MRRFLETGAGAEDRRAGPMGNGSEVTCWVAVWDAANGTNYIGTCERVEAAVAGTEAAR